MSLTPDNWVVTTFRDVTSYISRGKSPKYTEFSKLPVVNQRAIRWHGIQTEYIKFIHPDQIDQWTSERFIQEGDVLWNSTGTGTIGRACLVRKAHLSPPKVVDSHVTIIRPNKEVMDPRYLFAWIRSPEIQKAIVDLSSGSTNQIELNRSTIAEIHLPLAPLNEQKRIADKLEVLLARVDACSERLDRVPLILKRFRQGVLTAATSGALTEEWREKRKLKTASVKMLSEVVALKTGPFGSVLHKEDYVGNGVPVINPMHINNGRITPTSSISISARKADELKEFRLKKGDVIISRRGVMGRCAVVTEVEDNWLCGTGSMVLRPTKDLAPAYLQICLSSPDVVSTLEHQSVGSTMINLNQSILFGLKMSIPSISEQREIVHRVKTLFAFADRLEARYFAACVQVENITPALLAKAFRGELVPQDLNDEPANELLKRIKGQKTNEPEQKRVPRTNKIKKERHMKTKEVATLNELVSALDELGGYATADRLVIESGLSDDIDRFFELLREGRNTLLDVPVGSNKPIRRIANANQ